MGEEVIIPGESLHDGMGISNGNGNENGHGMGSANGNPGVEAGRKQE